LDSRMTAPSTGFFRLVAHAPFSVPVADTNYRGSDRGAR
jgi:hypothetical protein